MSSQFTLIGAIPVIEGCAAQFAQLVEQLEPTNDEFVHIVDGRLYVYMDSPDVPFCFIAPARKALFDFCDECATEATLFSTDDGMLMAGAKSPYLSDQMVAANQAYASVMQEADFAPSVYVPAGVSAFSLMVPA